MIAALLQPAAYDHPVDRIELIETHISWILLTGSYAYKLKKPVNFGFVDFGTPEKRRWFCAEELRLNRRLAPNLYLGLRTVHGPAQRASFHGAGPPLEMAVQMLQFSQQDLLPGVLARGELDPEQLDQLADSLAGFHAMAATASAGQPFGDPQAVGAPAFANLDAMQANDRAPEQGSQDADRLQRLRRWTGAEWQRLAATFAARKAEGAVRECHGDLHLGNMVRYRGRIEVFDCLEFSEALRWIDRISDIAFLAMDLEQRGRADAAHRVLGRWLESSGDYPGLLTWRWYQVYRALVRAKVTTLRLSQGQLAREVEDQLRRERAGYLSWADQATHPAPAALVITHGVSGSGKTHIARVLCERLGWIHLRSDVERLRLFGRWGPEPVAVLDGDPYRPEVSERIYGQRLVACAEAVLAAGLSVIVDATFLRRRDRLRMGAVAADARSGFAILECRCSVDQARRRIGERRRGGGDPSEADESVLEQQLITQEPLAAEEIPFLISVPTDQSGPQDGFDSLLRRLRTIPARLPP